MKYKFKIPSSSGYMPRKASMFFVAHLANTLYETQRMRPMQLNQHNFTIRSTHKSLTHNDDWTANKESVYGVDKIIWTQNVHKWMFREIRMLSQFAIRDSVWPWTQSHMYIAVQKAFKSRYGAAQVESLSSIVFLALLDFKDCLFQPLPFFTLFTTLGRLPGALVNVLSLPFPKFKTPEVFQKQKRRQVRRVQRSIGNFTGARTQGQNLVKTVAFLLLPIVIHRINTKLSMETNMFSLEKIVTTHSYKCSTLCRKNIIEQNNVVYPFSYFVKNQYLPDQSLVSNGDVVTNNFQNLASIVSQINKRSTINYTPTPVYSTFHNLFQLQELSFNVGVNKQNCTRIGYLFRKHTNYVTRFYNTQTLSNVFKVHSCNMYLRFQTQTQLCDTWNVLSIHLRRLLAQNTLNVSNTLTQQLNMWWNLPVDLFIYDYQNNIGRSWQESSFVTRTTSQPTSYNELIILRYKNWSNMVMQWRENKLQFKLPFQQIFPNTLNALQLAQKWLITNPICESPIMHHINMVLKNNINVELTSTKINRNWASILLEKKRKSWQEKVKDWQFYSLNTELENKLPVSQFQPDIRKNNRTQFKNDISQLKHNCYILLNQNKVREISNYTSTNKIVPSSNKERNDFPNLKQAIFSGKLEFRDNNWPENSSYWQKWQTNEQHDYTTNLFSHWIWFDSIFNTKDQQIIQRVNYKILNVIDILCCNQISHHANYLLQTKKNTTYKKTIHNSLITKINQPFSEFNRHLLSSILIWSQKPWSFKRMSTPWINSEGSLSLIGCTIQMKVLSRNKQPKFHKQLIMLVEEVHHNLNGLNKKEPSKAKYNFIWNRETENHDTEFLYVPIVTHTEPTNNINHAIFWIPSSFTDTLSDQLLETSTEGELVSLGDETYVAGYNEESVLIRPKIKLNFWTETHHQLFDWRLSYYQRVLQLYNRWIVTPYWWTLINQAFNNLFDTIWQTVRDNVDSLILPVMRDLIGQPNNKYCIFPVRISQIDTISNNNFAYKWNEFLWQELQQTQNNFQTIWNYLKVIQCLGANEWLILGYFSSIYGMCSYSLAVCIGAAHIVLWDKWKKLRYWSGSSLDTTVDSKFPTKRLVGKWWLNTTNVDLHRKQKGVIVQYLVSTKMLLKSQINKHLMARHSQFVDQSIEQTGWDYLHNYIVTYHSSPNYMLRNIDQRDNYKYVYYGLYSSETFASQARLIGKKSICEVDLSIKNKVTLPTPIELEHIPMRGLLLIGPQEVGKTYLAKSLAANANIPLVHICIDRLIHINPDLEIGVQIDSKTGPDVTEDIVKVKESVKKLNILLLLARRLENCIVWITSLHELNADPDYDNAVFDPAFLLPILLKNMTKDMHTHFQPKITFIGSSNNTRQLDPALVWLGRFQKLIRLRIPTQTQRAQILLSFLHTKGFNVRNQLDLAEIGNQTMGYTLRDMAGLVNEVLLITRTKRFSSINTSILKVALHRQMSAFEKMAVTTKYLASNEDLAYKIGKALVRKGLQPLLKQNECWKTRFYYLSNFYIENNVYQSSITEFLILPHIYNCLAGSAARDAWIILQGKVEERTLILRKQVHHERMLASTLFTALYADLPWIDICKKLGQSNQFVPKLELKTGHFLSILEKLAANSTKPNNTFDTTFYNRNIFTHGMASMSDKLPDEIIWSPRVQRLHMYRSFMFDITKTLSTPRSIYSIARYGTSEPPLANRDEDADYWKSTPYDRKLLKEKAPQMRMLESLEKRRWFKQRTESMGLPILSKHLMEYKTSYHRVFSLAGRGIWDSQDSSNARHMEFSTRDLLANPAVLDTLYTTYSAQRKQGRVRSKYKFQTSPFWLLEKLKLEMEPLQDKKDDSAIVRAIKKELREDKEISRYRLELFQIMVSDNSQLQRPQLALGKTQREYFEIWVDQIPIDSLARFDLLHHQEQLRKQKHMITMETLIHKFLLEVYNTLLNFFMVNRVLLNDLTNVLQKEGILWPYQIEELYQDNKIVFNETSIVRKQ